MADRLVSPRAKKQDRETIAELEQIINDLIQDKNELLRIGQAFEAELVAQQLSSGDVEYITSHLVPVIKKLVDMSAAAQAEGAEQVLEAIGPILSKETATVLQLLASTSGKQSASRSLISSAR